MPPFLENHKRTHSCGQLRAQNQNQTVTLFGWVQGRRDLGGRIFIDVRDRDGLTQVVFGPDIHPEAYKQAEELRSEFCIAIFGNVVLRTASGGKANPKLATGEIEVEASQLHIFSRAATPPFHIEDGIATREEIRLKYRYLDLRRPELQKNFLLRSALYHATRQYFHQHKFCELETPFMGKYTPGGARNFLVPSRLNAGKFYALAESPQLYKQLFMVAGLEKYFQIVRCFRDEDLRQDRQPEFTQIDVEMSFVTEEDIYSMAEGLMKQIWQETLGVTIPTPFERMTYQHAMDHYGVDKPDLRNPLLLHDITPLVKQHQGGGIPLFAQTLESQGVVKLLHIPAKHANQLSNTEVRKLEDEAKALGAAGLAMAKLEPAGEGAQALWVQSPLAKSVSADFRLDIHRAISAQPGDLLLFQMGASKRVNAVLGAMRQKLGTRLNLLEESTWRFLWVTEFPLFEQNEQGHWVAAHHPFTSPKPEHLSQLATNPGQVQARAYDLVLNGNEIGGGSIRIHQPEVQAQVFAGLGLSEEERQTKFGFLLEAFQYGAPPHGGIAFGLDRLAMLLCRADSLRDVIAFPKTQQGTDLMTECPTEVSSKQLEEVGIRTK